MKKIIIYFVVFLFLVSFVFAHGDEKAEGKELIDKKAKCSDLNDEQLEHIGDYLMEQMHPGEDHEVMDKAMGGEGSEKLKQIHINMAKMMYCGEGNMMKMMGGGIMMQGNMMNQGMMGNIFWMNPFWSLLLMILVIIALVLLIVWLFKKITEKKK